MSNDLISHEESLDIISKMIQASKSKKHVTDSYHYLMWGYLVLFASIGQFLLIKIGYADISYYPWALMLLGAMASFWIYFKQDREKKVKTYIDSVMKSIWLGFTGGFVAVCCIFPPQTLQFLPLVLVLYGVALFITGNVVRFLPSKLGGMLCWVLGVIAFPFNQEGQLLTMSVAVLFSYIIPGHLIYRESQK